MASLLTVSMRSRGCKGYDKGPRGLRKWLKIKRSLSMLKLGLEVHCTMNACSGRRSLPKVLKLSCLIL